MASNGTIAHRFANRDYNESKGLKGSNTSISGKNYYSYSTVFGQWVDEKVCLVYHGSTSVTSHKHMLYGSDFPKDVTLFPYDDGGHGGYYNSWHGCDLLGYRGKFDYDARVRLIDYWVSEIYDALRTIVGGKSKNLDKHAERVIAEYWAYVEKLCSMYKDTTIPKWLKKKRIDMDGTWKLKKVVVKALYNGERNVETLTDTAFGQGTYKAYWDYCARYRKAADKRAKIEALCERLGIRSPYEKWGGYNTLDHEMSADDIRKLTAKERLDLHFKALARKEYNAHESERKEKYARNFRNAYKWIVGFEPKKKSWGVGYEDEVENNCVNKDTGVVYECSGSHGMYDCFDWVSTIVRFDYDDFRKSEDKDEWIANFYKKCEYAAMLRRAYNILKRVNAHFEERSFREKKFLDDDYLRENTTEAEYIICSEFIAKQDKHYADEEARRRAEEIARLKREEEERKEREYMEQVKKEQIEECIKEGTEGCRDLWRKHLTSLAESEEYYDEVAFDSDGDFFYGGNILLRLNLNKDKVETSKNIRIPVEVCKKMWKIVSKWHENPKCFKPMQIDTKGSGTYTISSYKNDILTAGCHDIAYAEMERMYNEIINS